jgi:hypothetical protein
LTAASDSDRLAGIRAAMSGRTQYEGRAERDDEFLLRLLTEAVRFSADLARDLRREIRSVTFLTVALRPFAAFDAALPEDMPDIEVVLSDGKAARLIRGDFREAARAVAESAIIHVAGAETPS